ncbi:MATE family efflux transporter [Propionispora vibrioides]|uniref:Multidrug export protein MepA n=1 Tax=Propionispora vibrioides TaxID=112903 RepID=A0A1H8Y076_9FIRM|nr:MATE family efflux transporter [Propionispora vibrioides]SEP45525.1 putative efflux protein, MATE family [Propionispora vibrioides]
MEGSAALGQERVDKLLWRYSVPAMIGMVVNALYNIVDSIFVGNGVGEFALAAVAIAFPVMIILMGFGMLIGVGAGSLVSIRMGEGRKEDAEKILGNAFTLSVLCAIVLSAIILPFLDPVLQLLGAEPNILPYARDFTKVILWGSLFMYVGFGLNSIVRAQGDPKIAMATMLISAGINVVLNPLFIFYFQLGITGSALATVIAQMVASVWIILHFLRKKSYLRLKNQYMALDFTVVFQIIKTGASPFLMQIAASVVNVLFNHSLLLYGGEIAVACIGVITRIGMLLLMPIFGISQGAQPIIGYNYGARSYNRVIEAVRRASYAASALSLAGFLVVQFFSESIVGVFNQNAEFIAIGAKGLRLFLLLLPVIGFQVIGANYFQAVGKAQYAIFFSMSRQVIILIPMLLLLPPLFGLNGAWAAAPLADLGSFLLTGYFLFKEIRTLRQSETL